jgi:hypothetical protein
MTPARFLECLDALGWSQRYLAWQLECDTNLPTRWARGTAPVPPAIAAWLEASAACIASHPVPQDWRTRPV